MLPSPLVHGEAAVHIGGGGHHRRAANEPGHQPGQVIGTPHVAGEEGHNKASRLVHRHHGGVGKFILHIGGDGPDGNTTSPYEEEGVGVGEPFPGPLPQAPVAGEPRLRRQPLRHRQGAAVADLRQIMGQLSSQSGPPAGKGGEGDPHLLASR